MAPEPTSKQLPERGSCLGAANLCLHVSAANTSMGLVVIGTVQWTCIYDLSGSILWHEQSHLSGGSTHSIAAQCCSGIKLTVCRSSNWMESSLHMVTQSTFVVAATLPCTLHPQRPLTVTTEALGVLWNGLGTVEPTAKFKTNITSKMAPCGLTWPIRHSIVA